MKSEEQIKSILEKMEINYRENVASGFCSHGAPGEVAGICSNQLGQIEALKWVLEDED